MLVYTLFDHGSRSCQYFDSLSTADIHSIFVHPLVFVENYRIEVSMIS